MCIFTVYFITKYIFLFLLHTNQEMCYLPVLRHCLGFISIVATFLCVVVSVSSGFACSCSAPVLWANPYSVICYIRVGHPWFDVSEGGEHEHLSFLRCCRHMLLCRNLQPPSLHSKSKVYVTAFSILAFVFLFTVELLLRLLVLIHGHTVLVPVLRYVNHIFWPDYLPSTRFLWHVGTYKPNYTVSRLQCSE